jgi:zinc protease
MNAFVREDYSAYFATLPAARLQFAMSMEADRMANIAEVLDDERIELQRDIAINELRQREAQPYGCVPRMIAGLLHHADHPYAHPPDGLEAGLRNVSGDDVRAWIASRHRPATATLIVAGDVEPRRVIDEAERNFGPLANNGPDPRPATVVTNSLVASRSQIAAPVKHARLFMAWNGPPSASTEYPAVEAACEILAGSQSARLSRRVEQAERLASEIALELRPRESGVLIVLSVTARTGVSLWEIEAVVREEIERLKRGPELLELDAARLRLFGKMVRGFERVGGPNSKSDALGLAAIVSGSPDSHASRLSIMAAMQPDAVAAASRWLARAGAVLEIYPLLESSGH